MEKTKIKVGILPNIFLKEDGIFDKDKALMLSGKIAGVCYNQEGFAHLENEDEEKTLKRIDLTLNNGHHSVYDHIYISFNLQNVPKILAIVLNNEHQYTTSEKSLRYTLVENNNSVITEKEVILYNKWMEIFQKKINELYGDFLKKSKIKKLAQENARYLVTVFIPTQMIYTTSLRQINYLVSWMKIYIKNSSEKGTFEKKLAASMQELIDELERLNVLDPGLLKNEKCRELSLFGHNLKDREEFFGYAYSTNYLGSYAQLAHVQRHRTLHFQIEILDKKEFFIPPIIQDDKVLVDEWLQDIESIQEYSPQGELILINETGSYEDFILKAKERLCSEAQLEITTQTRKTLLKFKENFEKNNHPLLDDIKTRTKGARCTFKDFTCSRDCNFKEGKNFTRKV